MKTIDIHQWRAVLISVAEEISAHERELNVLDSLVGDGDHGSSIRRGFEAAKAGISGATFNSVGELFSRIGSVMIQEIGGAIGPLLGSFFMEAGKHARELQETDLTAWSVMFAKGVEKVHLLGKASPGDKTMLDAMQPAADAFQEAARLGLPMVFAFRKATSAARHGADLTVSMVAKFGRAKFLGERAIGHQDAGANSIYLMLNAMAEALGHMDKPGDMNIHEDGKALKVSSGQVHIQIQKEKLLFEISSTVSSHVLKQARPLSFLTNDGQSIPLVRMVRWHLENTQLIITCQLQGKPQEVYLLIDFPLPSTCRIASFGTPEDLQQCSIKFTSTSTENFFGGGERFSTVNQRGKRFECWADDRGPDQKPDHPWTYWPVPFVISNLGYSLFLNNNEKSVFDLCAAIPDEFEVVTDSAQMSIEISWAAQPVELIQHLFQRTGFPPLPPNWNNGVWVTCLGGEKAVLEQARLLREAHVPCSALWVYDAYDAKGNIGLPICPMHHSGDYPNIPGLVDELHRMGFKVQTYLFPYFYVNTAPYGEAHEKGYFLKKADGTTYKFPFWKAIGRNMVKKPASIVDFTNPEAKAWWQGLIRYILVDLGFDGWMHDFAENIPEGVVAYNGLSGAELHNLYPVLYQQATREACLQVKPDASFYARSGYTGSQSQLTAAWPGDQICTWGKIEGLSSAVTACLSLSLSGMFFLGPDIGGYFGRWMPQEVDCFSKELWIRWVQFGALSSIMRDHLSDKPNGSVSLWSDAETLAIFKKYAWLHMSLSPYLQGCAAQSIKTGRPVMQHMFLVDPENPVYWNCDDQYILGDAMLVAPILQDGQRSRSIHLPQGNWIGYWDGKVYEGGKTTDLPAPLDQIPILVKEGTVLPTLLDPADTLAGASDGSVQTATENLRLQVYLPQNWKNTATSPGNTRRELSDGTVISSEWSTNSVRLQVDGTNHRVYHLVIPGADKPINCSVNGQAITVSAAAADKRVYCWHEAGSQSTHVHCDESKLDVKVSY